MRPTTKPVLRTSPETGIPPLRSKTDRYEDQNFHQITEAIQRINEAIMQAVDQGVCIELVRASRYHDGCRNWGDQITHIIHGKTETR